jgi:hypothetical protein
MNSATGASTKDFRNMKDVANSASECRRQHRRVGDSVAGLCRMLCGKGEHKRALPVRSIA